MQQEGQLQLEFLNLLLVALVAGIMTATYYLHSLSMLIVMSIFLLLILVTSIFVYKSRKKTGVLFFLLFFFFGMFRYLSVIDVPFNDIQKLVGENTLVTGILAQNPRILQDARGSFHVRYIVDVKSVTSAKKTATGRCYVYAFYQEEKDIPTVSIGDTLSFKGKVSLVRAYKNPGRIDTKLRARIEGVTAIVRTGTNGVKKITGLQKGYQLEKLLANIRLHYLNQMEKVMPKADSAAIFAILFGGYEGIRPELIDAFTVTGLLHLLSVSGSHITLLAVFILAFFRKIHVHTVIATIFVSLAIIFYCLLADGVVPAIRAGLMGIIATIAMTKAWDFDGRRILTLCAIFFIMYSPLYIYDVSFQLSFASTAGLLYLAPKILEYLTKIPYLLRVSIAITVAAQLASLPFILWYFHYVSFSSLVANFFLVPIVELILLLGLFGGVLSYFFPILGKLIFVLDSLFLGFVYEGASLLAKIPYSTVYLPAFSFIGAILYLIFLLIFFHQQLREKIAVFLFPYRKLLASIFLLFILVNLFSTILRPKEMSVHFIDVGQGDALLVITPNKHAFMIDTGGARDFPLGLRVDIPYLFHYGVEKLDAIFLTHAHDDHSAGAGGILPKIAVQKIIAANEGKEIYASVMKMPHSDIYLKNFSVAQEGEVYNIDDVHVEVVHAPKNEHLTGNEYSNVYRISYGKASFLITGDLVTAEEKNILNKYKHLQTTVLKVAHHGSLSSSSMEFLQQVKPHFAVISVGEDNSFGHPHKEVLERLQSLGTVIYRTDQDGAVVFYTNGEKIRLESFVKRH